MTSIALKSQSVSPRQAGPIFTFEELEGLKEQYRLALANGETIIASMAFETLFRAAVALRVSVDSSEYFKKLDEVKRKAREQR